MSFIERVILEDHNALYESETHPAWLARSTSIIFVTVHLNIEHQRNQSPCPYDELINVVCSFSILYWGLERYLWPWARGLEPCMCYQLRPGYRAMYYVLDRPMCCLGLSKINVKNKCLTHEL